jgi:hypothetical protein
MCILPHAAVYVSGVCGKNHIYIYTSINIYSTKLIYIYIYIYIYIGACGKNHAGGARVSFKIGVCGRPAACLSKLVCVGDLLVAVGGVSVRHMDMTVVK